MLAALLFSEAVLLISSLDKLHVGGLVRLGSLAEVEVLMLGHFGELASPLLQLVQVVLGSSDALRVLSVLALFVAVHVT